MNMTDMFWVATQLCWWVTRAAISNEMAMTWKLYCTQKFARLGPIIPLLDGILLCVLVPRASVQAFERTLLILGRLSVSSYLQPTAPKNRAQASLASCKTLGSKQACAKPQHSITRSKQHETLD